MSIDKFTAYRNKETGAIELFQFDRSINAYRSATGAGAYGPGAFGEMYEEVELEVRDVEVPEPETTPDGTPNTVWVEKEPAETVEEDRPPEEFSKKELKARAAELGLEYPSRATVKDLIALIEGAEHGEEA
jgi:hypothetical protein